MIQFFKTCFIEKLKIYESIYLSKYQIILDRCCYYFLINPLSISYNMEHVIITVIRPIGAGIGLLVGCFLSAIPFGILGLAMGKYNHGAIAACIQPFVYIIVLISALTGARIGSAASAFLMKTLMNFML